MIEERCQVQNCLFRQGDYRNKGHKPEKLLGLSPNLDGFCSSESKHDRRMVQKEKLFVLARRLQKLRSQTRKTVQGSSLYENVEFRDNSNLFL
jgi:hypothetical protein